MSEPRPGAPPPGTSGLRLALKPQARIDLIDVLYYTRELWGAEQHGRYKALLDQALRELIDYPDLGRARNELFAGCRARRVGQHVIYYHVTDVAIVVTRLLHVRQDPADQVEP